MYMSSSHRIDTYYSACPSISCWHLPLRFQYHLECCLSSDFVCFLLVYFIWVLHQVLCSLDIGANDSLAWAHARECSYSCSYSCLSVAMDHIFHSSGAHIPFQWTSHSSQLFIQ